MKEVVISFSTIHALDIVRKIILCLFGLLSVASCPIGFLCMRTCPSNEALPIWLTGHGFLTALYYIVSLTTFISQPLRLVEIHRKKRQLQCRLDKVVEEIGQVKVPPHLLEDSSRIKESKRFFSTNEKITLIFSVLVSLSIFSGVSLLVLTDKNLCQRLPFFYSISVVATSILLLIVYSVFVVVSSVD